LLRRFFNFKLARSPSTQKKFCKNFELIQEGEMDAIVNITLEEESCSNVIMEMNKPVS